MYNYWRWFPTGKVIFLAPTLPLVNQQVQACYNIMGIDPKETAIMTGKMPQNKRLEQWQQRRVFYCTPQTVQKDLPKDPEEESPFGKQVVCLVLDEAHKATGDYAYVKVIEQLEACGAKFRIVGLSATPGTSIKAIQQVIEALRSSKIEARHESDPSVQPYLHEKHSEIVIVPKNDTQRLAERQITQMLGPHLEQLKAAGAMRMGGGPTLTPFAVVQARRDFLARSQGGPPPGFLLAHFGVVQKLVELRNDAHQSLGVVRSKLLRLKNEPQRGLLSAMVKSSAFATLMDLVLDATKPSQADCTFSQQHSTPKNNPKLAKLAELLQEHFSRAQACGKSSRVIVFSQFRDSVAEIVALLRTLEPTVRPHHFVGQGKPPKGAQNKEAELQPEHSASLIRLRGMKQAEQQDVIHRFRQDVFNVLVCTCIGEEGLDIGEVDLIVNYDTLRSPIRMIQRTGRTGRKRDGRVVCLIAEGQEQRTFELSKQAEKTLQRALTRKSNFTLSPHAPLLPSAPTLQNMVMSISSQIHLSQVAGSNNVNSLARKPTASKRYKLDALQEQERQQRIGEMVTIETSEVPWKTLRRALLKHRTNRQLSGGRTVTMLQSLASFGPVLTEPNLKRVSRVESHILKVFPVDRPFATLERIEKLVPTDAPRVPAVDDSIERSVSPAVEEVRKLELVTEAINNEEPNTEVEPQIKHPLGGVCDGPVFCLSTPPSSSEDEDEQPEDDDGSLSGPPNCHVSHQGPETAHLPPTMTEPQKMFAEMQPSLKGKMDRLTSLAFDSNENHSDDAPIEKCESECSHPHQEENACDEVDFAKFQNSVADIETSDQSPIVLPSRQGNRRHYVVEESPPLHSRQPDSTVFPSPRVGKDLELVDTPPSLLRPSVRQQSSSLCECTEDDNKHHRFEESPSQGVVVRIGNKRRLAIAETPSQHSMLETDIPSPFHANHLDMSEGAGAPTPESTTCRLDKKLSEHDRISTTSCAQGDDLTDTPPTKSTRIVVEASKVTCSICHSLDSLVENPIVLCDGCNLGFHKLCYAIDADLDSPDPWFCDTCKVNEDNSPRSCLLCSNERGPMKKQASHSWCHPVCEALTGMDSLTSRPCMKCNRDGGIRCFSCTSSMHPYCAINEPQMGLWTLVLTNLEGSSSRTKSTLFCPAHTDGVNIFISIHPEIVGQMRVVQSRDVRRHGGYETYQHQDVDSSPMESTRQERRRKRQAALARFIVDEAEIASDADMEGDEEEDEIRRLEADELSHDSFINDATELTQHFSQDNLAGIDPDADEYAEGLHRALDAQHAREDQFRTPRLNRRMKNPESSQLTSSSQKGLGNMHFIRSVLEHHRQGGQAEDIEAVYNELEGSAVCEQGSPPLPPERLVIQYLSSDSESADSR
eukprot:Nitzschia sp. Nitz4//scaffold226_size53432//45759//49904//NITZ4_006708-RA/size53432-processed-gene-0.27-mRNA-1//1//CDS//3329542772//231//frame0